MTQEPNPHTMPKDAKVSASKSRGRHWFIAPAVLCFLGLLFTNRYYYTGKVLMACPLWQYYMMEARKGFPSLMGTSLGGSRNAIVSTMVIHLGLSVLLGMIVYGLRWFVVRRRKES
ncbi:hypothetical protein SH501x_001928 [Pirellulaceae bacterium SH501]